MPLADEVYQITSYLQTTFHLSKSYKKKYRTNRNKLTAEPHVIFCEQ